jgi:hypothetical protein
LETIVYEDIISVQLYKDNHYDTNGIYSRCIKNNHLLSLCTISIILVMPENIRRINNMPYEKAVTIVGLLDQKDI